MTNRPTQTQGSRRWFSVVSIGVASVITTCGFLWLIADYDCNSRSCELLNRMSYGTGFVESAGWRDLRRAFDWYNLELGMPRARFLSYAMEILNFRFRLFLWQYVTPHASLSFVWLFSLASLWLLYMAARELGFCRAAAACSVVVYSSSIGFLSGVAFLDHPAKPMANVFTIAAIYIYSRVDRKSPNTLFANMSRRAVELITLYVFIGLFLDETVVLVFAIIPVMCPMLFLPRRSVEAWFDKTSKTQFVRDFCRNDLRRFCGNGLVFGLPAILFAACVLLVAPTISWVFGYWPFQYLSSAAAMGQADELNIWFIPLNLVSLLAPSLLLDISTADHGDVLWWVLPKHVSWQGATVVVLCLSFFGAAAWDCFRRQRVLFLKTGVAMIVALVLITIFFSGIAGGGAVTGFYYGNQFSIFYALFFGLLLNPTEKRLDIIGKVILIVVVLVQTGNAHRMCQQCQGGGCFYDELLVAHSGFPVPIAAAYPQVDVAVRSDLDRQERRRFVEKAYPRVMRGSKQEIVRIWTAWQRDRKTIENITHPVSRSNYWVICELAQINKIERRSSEVRR